MATGGQTDIIYEPDRPKYEDRPVCWDWLVQRIICGKVREGHVRSLKTESVLPVLVYSGTP